MGEDSILAVLRRGPGSTTWKDRVSALGGHVGVDSHVGAGTTVTGQMPYSSGARQQFLYQGARPEGHLTR